MSTATGPVSERKLAANRANAARSTGPRTAEGKARVRDNALKHGLRAEQVVLPWEDPAEFEAMRQTWVDEWRPPTDSRRLLVELAASRAWRLRRCIKGERDELARLGDEAIAQHDRAIKGRVDRALDLFQDDPSRANAALRRDREGVEVLIGLWSRAAETLESPSSWNDVERHHGRLLNLHGHRADADPADLGAVALCSWRLLEFNDPTPLPPGEPAIGPDEAEETARALRAHVLAMVAELTATLATLPDPALTRRRAAESAAYDVSRSGLDRLRYEGYHDRSFRATLNQLIGLTRTGADLVDEADDEAQPVDIESVATPESVAPNKATEPDVAIAITPIEAPEIAAPNKATEPVVAVAIAPIEAPEIAAPNKATEPAPMTVVTPVEAVQIAATNKATEEGRTPSRDRDGRIWPVTGPDDAPSGVGKESPVADDSIITRGPS